MQLSSSEMNRDDRTTKTYSVLLAVLANIPSINSIFIAFFPSATGKLMSLLYSAVCSLTILLTIKWSNGIRVKKYNAIILLFITTIYIITFLSVPVSNPSLSHFLIFVIFPLVVMGEIHFESYLFITTCLLINLPGVFVIDRIFLIYRNSISMGISYTFLFPCLCALSYLIKIKKKNILFSIISLIELVYLYQIVLHGSRGVILSVGIGLAFLALLSYDIRNKRIKMPSLKLSVLVMFSIILLFNIETVIMFLYNTTRSMGYEFQFLSKSIKMLQLSNISNGREDIYQIAIRGFFDRPVFGHGIATFEYYTGIEYPHNFILQVLFDLGIAGLVVIIIPFIIGFIKWIKHFESESYLVYVLFFVSSVPGALFSHDLWENMLLWITISLFIGIIPQNSSIRLNFGKS